MKRFTATALSLTVISLLLAGCGGNNQPNNNNNADNNQQVTSGAAAKTGYAIVSSIAKSKDAGETEGLGQADTSFVAVTVDKDGKVVKCFIDGIQTKINFSTAGKITTDLASKFQTKQELGTQYGMKSASSIGKEWNEEATALANYVIGKTADQINGIAVNEKGAPADKELSSSVTFSISGYKDAIVKAINNAQDLGAKTGDKLGVGALTNISKSKDAAEADGLAQAYSSYTIATFDANGKITSCIIDGTQTNINFNKAGKVTSDLNSAFKTKVELGTGYGMSKASSIGKEWFEEAAALSKYVTGKTISEVKGIAVNAEGAPTAEDLKSSVTISIGDYVAALEKASANAK